MPIKRYIFAIRNLGGFHRQITLGRSPELRLG